jgi:hypothetical protein
MSRRLRRLTPVLLLALAAARGPAAESPPALPGAEPPAAGAPEEAARLAAAMERYQEALRGALAAATEAVDDPADVETLTRRLQAAAREAVAEALAAEETPLGRAVGHSFAIQLALSHGRRPLAREHALRLRELPAGESHYIQAQQRRYAPLATAAALQSLDELPLEEPDGPAAGSAEAPAGSPLTGLPLVREAIARVAASERTFYRGDEPSRGPVLAGRLRARARIHARQLRDLQAFAPERAPAPDDLATQVRLLYDIASTGDQLHAWLAPEQEVTAYTVETADGTRRELVPWLLARLPLPPDERKAAAAALAAYRQLIERVRAAPGEAPAPQAAP